MSSSIRDLESSQYAKLLKEECLSSIPQRRWKEILLLALFLVVFTITTVYLWVNSLIYDYWFYISIGIVLLIVLAGYLMDRRNRPDWKYYFLEILKETKGVDTVELSDFLNEDQPFFGANLGNCEKFIKIAENFIKENVIEIVIRGSGVYLKGYEPPEEEEEEESEKESE